MNLGVTGLAAVRALGRRGIPVFGVATPDAVGLGSRYVQRLAGPASPDETLVLPHYLGLARRLGRVAVLVPTSDPDVLFVSRHRKVLAEQFAFHVAEPELLEAVASKRQMVALAKRCGLPVPTTVLPETRWDLERAIPQLRFPCVIKPEFTRLWRTADAETAGLAEKKAIPIVDATTLLAQYDAIAAVDPRVVVQEMVIGPDENHLDYHALVDREGRVSAEFAGRKLRVAPAYFGSGSYVESIRSGEVIEAGRLVLERLGYQGMANLNFKRDARDGRLYLLEVNPRFSLWTSLDVACGVDFPYYYYRAALGQDFSAPTSYPAGRRWLNPLTDFRAMRVYARDGSWSWSRWLRSLTGVSTNAVFTWDDPLPGVELLTRSLAARGRPARTEAT